MKKILLIILIGFSLFSCQKDNIKLKKSLLGTWNNFPDNLNNEIQFYKDSVVLWDLCRKSSATWKVDQEKIYFQYIKTPPDTQKNNWSLNYNLNGTKDSLILTHENDTTKILMQKVDNHWEHYLKSYQLKINLPENGPLSSLTQQENNFPNIFIGWYRKVLIVKGNNSSKTLKTSSDYFYSLMDNFHENYEDKNVLPIALIADKEVPSKSIDSIKEIIYNLKLDKKIYFYIVYMPKYTETD